MADQGTPNMRQTLTIAALVALTAAPLQAEQANYGEIELTGLARETWALNDFPMQNGMVCNVNGPDGFLSVRSGPGSDYAQVRAFKRLAVLQVDVTQRQGHWVRIVGGYRNNTPEGQRQEPVTFKITGWVHDNYLCDFLD